MGCDYYVWIETVVQYIDESGNIKSFIEGEKPKDADFEVSYGLNDEIRDYNKKILYENFVWRCLPQGMLRIQKLCYKNKIPLNSLITVFKFKNGYNVKDQLQLQLQLQL